VRLEDGASLLVRIVSGGQSGVDRAALDLALALGVQYGGWCPCGGWAEDHPTAPGLLVRYPALCETPSADPAQRTAWNVRDSHATLVLRLGSGGPGTALAERVAVELARPLAVVDLLDARRTGEDRAMKAAHGLVECLPPAGTLNVGGPRESEAPGVYASSLEFLARLLLGRVGR
jgi:Circularly permutated YpsA SLOG family